MKIVPPGKGSDKSKGNPQLTPAGPAAAPGVTSQACSVQ